MIYCVMYGPRAMSVNAVIMDKPNTELDVITKETRHSLSSLTKIDVMYTEAETPGDAFLNYISKKTETAVEIN